MLAAVQSRKPSESEAPDSALARTSAPDEDTALQARAELAIELLEAVRERRALLAALTETQRARLLRAAGEVARPDPWAKRELVRAAHKRRREAQREADERKLAETGIRKKRKEEVFSTPLFSPPVLAGVDIDAALVRAPLEVRESRSCYVCKQQFTELHFFYDAMCRRCGDFNHQKRAQTADLTGRVALITGARVKIGYQAAIMLLRAGARVIVTTRFARDAAARYAREPDFPLFRERLSIYGLDLRHTPSVELFARHLSKKLDRLDYILNNACQTVRRPAGFYEHLLHGEAAPLAALSEPEQALVASYEALRQHGALPAPGAQESPIAARIGGDDPLGLIAPAALSQLALLEDDLTREQTLFPAGKLDADLQQVDLRQKNSWRLGLSEVSAVELLEVQLVNAVAPFILNARLKELMLRSGARDMHVVNVSAMEGQFYRTFKTDKHPHTNMAKAALNMMTRTSAPDYVRDGIHMNSVDTGWVTDEDAAEIAARKTREQGFHPPLDIVDGAARIVDPIFVGANTGEHAWGLFLKNYVPTDW